MTLFLDVGLINKLANKQPIIRSTKR